MKEKELIAQLKQRKQEAFKWVVYNYSPKLLACACLYTRNKQDAEDILQDSYVILYEKIKQFKGNTEAELYSWLKRIIINQALSKHRLKSYTQEVYKETQEELLEEPKSYSNLNVEDLVKLTFTMPLGFRQIFSLYTFESFSHKEISNQLGIKESSSRSQYVRARRWLISKIETERLAVEQLINHKS